MCKMCDEGTLHDHSGPQPGSRREFLKITAATGAAVAGLPLFGARADGAQDDDDLFKGSGQPGRRLLIRGGHVMSMDPQVGDFVEADVLVEGKKIVAVGPNLRAGGAAAIDARGRIVMPGFVDTHHHQFETALRSFLADGLLFNDGKPHGTINYFEHILGRFAPVYRPEDVYINELFGSLSQLDAASRPCTTSRRSITHPNTPTPRSRASPTRAAARSSAISKVLAPFSGISIQATRAASRTSTSPRAISS